MPTAANATAAFGTVLAPQSIATSGAYNTTDTRTVYKDLTNVAVAGDTAALIAAKVETVSRANPLHWANILYPSAYDTAGVALATTPKTLANPTAGYPVTGTTQILTYTCFSSSGKTHGVANYIQYVFGKVTKKNAIGGNPASISLSANTFPGTGATTYGILAKSNIATVPAGWRTAILETFLKKSTQASGGPTLGSLNLWIQSAQPVTAAGTAATSLNSVDANKNPVCISVTGA
jgi:hypothetical protein